MRGRRIAVSALAGLMVLSGMSGAQATDRSGTKYCGTQWGIVRFTGVAFTGELILKAPGDSAYEQFWAVSASDIADLTGGGAWRVLTNMVEKSTSVGCVPYA